MGGGHYNLIPKTFNAYNVNFVKLAKGVGTKTLIHKKRVLCIFCLLFPNFFFINILHEILYKLMINVINKYQG